MPSNLNDKQIQGLQRLLSLLDPDTLTKEDFVKSFENVVNLVKKIEAQNIQEFKQIQEVIAKLSQKLTDQVNLDVTDLNKKTMDYCKTEMERMIKAHEQKMMEVDDKMMEVKDGKDADEEMMINKIMEEIQSPIIEKMEKNMPQLGASVRDALELLQGKDKLGIEAIAGLQELLEELKNRKTTVGGGGGFSKIAMEIHFIDNETPSGTVNGVNTDFTLARTPNPTTSLKVYKDGQKMQLTGDYTLSGRTISFTSAPLTDSIILCDYRT